MDGSGSQLVVAAVAQRLLERVPELIEALGHDFAAEVPEYAALSDDTLRREVLPVTTTFVERFFAALAAGQAPDINDIPGVEEMGRRRLEMGIPLEAMLHVFRIAGRVVFEGIVREVRPGEEHAIGAIGAVWIDLIDHGSSRGASGYLQAAREQVRNVEARRSAVVDALLAANDRAEVAAVAAAHSVGLAREYTPVMASGEDLAVQLDRLVGASPEGSLAAWRGRAVLLLLPTADAERAALAEVLGDRTVVWGHYAAVGSGLRAEVDQVERILTLALERGLTGMLGPGDLLVERLVADGGGVADELTRRVLIPLRDADRSGLIRATLRSYFATGSVAETAAAESAHPNTINYRLRRVTAVTGYDPRVPVEAAVLVLALSCAHDIV